MMGIQCNSVKASTLAKPQIAFAQATSLRATPLLTHQQPFTSNFRSSKHVRIFQRSVVVMAADPSGSQSLAETAALDELIDSLLTASDATELTKMVAENMLSFDQRFWLRLATRSDTATSDEDKDKLSSLAKVVMQLVDAMVKQTTEQLSDSSTILQDILKAAADERTGEWQLPLSEKGRVAMQKAMDKYENRLDEALLSNCFAWMRKASDDKLEGMVNLLQIVLQVYAGRQLSANPLEDAGRAGELLQELLNTDEARWGVVLREKMKSDGVSESALMEALQRKMESVVLGLSSGSYAQRVQAEYLKELEQRARSVFEDLAAGR